MALRPEYAPAHPEFHDFLFAHVGEEKNGLQLTVLSALSRLGLDPWSEAARLSDLSEEKATSALATTIAELPEGHWKASESRSIAGRLVKLLPPSGSSPAGAPQGAAADRPKPRSDLRTQFLWIAVAALLAYLLYQNIL